MFAVFPSSAQAAKEATDQPQPKNAKRGRLWAIWQQQQPRQLLLPHPTSVVNSDPTTHGCDGEIMIIRKRKADSLGRVQAASASVAATARNNNIVVSQRLDDDEPCNKKTRVLPSQPNEADTTVSSSSSSSLSKSKSSIGSNSGRGSIVGWTTCPLCGKYSKKKYALGRGLATHLHSIHTPWQKPSKLVLKIRRRQLEELTRRKRQNQNDRPQQERQEEECKSQEEINMESWEPTQEEIDDWDMKVLSILRQVEQEQQRPQQDDAPAPIPQQEQQQGIAHESNASKVGYDRSGQTKVDTYRQSLPPFLQAAANGDLNRLQSMISDAINGTDIQQQGTKTTKKNGDSMNGSSDNKSSSSPSSSSNYNKRVQNLLDTTDRHMSTAEHWAAGGGHLDCLKLLMEMRLKYCTDGSQKNNNGDRQHASKNGSNDKRKKKKKLGRRDGKTCLHYAARNGQLECIQYLLHECKYFLQQDDQNEHEAINKTDTDSDNRSIIASKINERSGDGTTSFHMACYGGHPTVMRCLIEMGANVQLCNDWGCSSAHWIAMTISTNRNDIWECCNTLKQCGVIFTTKQSQGHSPLHKAAQKKNRHVIEWMAFSSTPAGGVAATTTAMTEPDNSCDDDEKLQQPQQVGANLSQEEKIAAGSPDHGGHLPSSIWLSVGGDPIFATWMKDVATGW